MFSSQDLHDNSHRDSKPAGQRQWPRAAVFDCDGLLIDTAGCWERAFDRSLSRQGRRLTAAMARELNGASIRSAAQLLEVPASMVREELEAAFQEARFTPLPGAIRLLTRLRPRMPLAVATNGPADLVAFALDQAGLGDPFEAIISAETQTRDKPAPDVYLAACDRLGVDPSDAIAFEDSAVGLRAAQSAGMTVVLVPSDPQERIPADLRVSRLDDQRVLGLLRLDDVARNQRMNGADVPQAHNREP